MRRRLSAGFVGLLVPVISTLAIVSCSGGGGSETTPSSAPTAPVISSQPSDQSVTLAHTATFKVVASGTPPLSFQWKKDGADVGVDSASYTTPATSQSDNGARFSVVVTNAVNTVVSRDAILTVSSTPALHPPEPSEVGPRIGLVSAPGGTLASGDYSGKTFTSVISLPATGTYRFTDCEFQQGFVAIFGGVSVTRTVTLDHCRNMSGLYFEYGGQKNWTITWCDMRGDGQAIRPNGLVMYDYVTPTPFVIEDSIVSISNRGTPAAHVEAMQSLGGNSMRYTRVRFITPGPYVNGVTGQTASVNHGGGNILFDACDFLSAGAFYYTVYSDGSSVLFRNCRLVRGLAGYVYPDSKTMAAFEGCIDIETGVPIH